MQPHFIDIGDKVGHPMPPILPERAYRGSQADNEWRPVYIRHEPDTVVPGAYTRLMAGHGLQQTIQRGRNFSFHGYVYQEGLYKTRVGPAGSHNDRNKLTSR